MALLDFATLVVAGLSYAPGVGLGLVVFIAETGPDWGLNDLDVVVTGSCTDVDWSILEEYLPCIGLDNAILDIPEVVMSKDCGEDWLVVILCVPEAVDLRASLDECVLPVFSGIDSTGLADMVPDFLPLSPGGQKECSFSWGKSWAVHI